MFFLSEENRRGLVQDSLLTVEFVKIIFNLKLDLMCKKFLNGTVTLRVYGPRWKWRMENALDPIISSIGEY